MSNDHALSGGLSKPELDQMHTLLSGHVERGEVPGLVALISHREERHACAVGTKAISGKDAVRRDTIFRIASMTKPVTAVASMVLIEDGKLALDEPVDRLLPELANRRVLKRLDSDLDETVPARRPITTRDLLTLRMGLGSIMEPPGTYPIQRAISELEIGGDGPPRPASTPATDEWMRRLGSLPLVYQPGERWMYHIGLDVLGVLIARASGQTLSAFMRERLFEPLGMKDTGFFVPADKLERLSGCYARNPQSGTLELFDGMANSQWSRPPAFETGGGGLVSTADDYLAFCRMMLNKGALGKARILTRESVELMTCDHVTPQQRVDADLFFEGNSSWGFGMAVYMRHDRPWTVPGAFGWTGGLGTTAYSDPTNDLVGILLTTRMLDSPEPPRVFTDFWTGAYRALRN